MALKLPNLFQTLSDRGFLHSSVTSATLSFEELGRCLWVAVAILEDLLVLYQSHSVPRKQTKAQAGLKLKEKKKGVVYLAGSMYVDTFRYEPHGGLSGV